MSRQYKLIFVLALITILSYSATGCTFFHAVEQNVSPSPAYHPTQTGTVSTPAPTPQVNPVYAFFKAYQNASVKSINGLGGAQTETGSAADILKFSLELTRHQAALSEIYNSVGMLNSFESGGMRITGSLYDIRPGSGMISYNEQDKLWRFKFQYQSEQVLRGSLDSNFLMYTLYHIETAADGESNDLPADSRGQYSEISSGKIVHKDGRWYSLLSGSSGVSVFIVEDGGLQFAHGLAQDAEAIDYFSDKTALLKSASEVLCCDGSKAWVARKDTF